jgi:hypothetical protein
LAKILVVLDARVNLTELSRFTVGVPFIFATIHGAMQKLLPVLTTTDLSPNVDAERKNDFASPDKKGINGVVGPLGFGSVFTSPNLLRRL